MFANNLINVSNLKMLSGNSGAVCVLLEILFCFFFLSYFSSFSPSCLPGMCLLFRCIFWIFIAWNIRIKMRWNYFVWNLHSYIDINEGFIKVPFQCNAHTHIIRGKKTRWNVPRHSIHPLKYVLIYSINIKRTHETPPTIFRSRIIESRKNNRAFSIQYFRYTHPHTDTAGAQMCWDA